MRIAQVATSSGPVREDRTGSVEALIWLLSRELVALGHEVTVFGCEGSEPPCELVVTQPGPYGENGAPSDWQLCDWMTLCRAVSQAHRFDVIHSHAYLWGLPLGPLSRAPMVHTMHTCPYDDEAVLLHRFPQASVTAVSEFQWRAAAGDRRLPVIHHGVDPARFTFRELPADYLCYLGRFIPGKGPLEAIRVARELGMPLVLAGPESEYFRSHILPLVDGRLIRYAGAVDRAGRDALLGGARALLYPLREPEPFGLVQVEAMMCGTPVVAPAIGACPEIVQDGMTGIIAPSGEAFAAGVTRAMLLQRPAIRNAAARRFSAARMTADYVAQLASIPK